MEQKYYISIELETLKQSLVTALNQSPLSYCLKQMVLGEVARVVQDGAKQELERDLAEVQKAREAEKSGDGAKQELGRDLEEVRKAREAGQGEESDEAEATASTSNTEPLEGDAE